MRAIATFTLVGLLIGGAAVHRVAVVIVAERPSMTSQLTDRNKESLLQAFADAWNRHDVDALMSMMTTDCVFEASGGNAVDGERYGATGSAGRVLRSVRAVSGCALG